MNKCRQNVKNVYDIVTSAAQLKARHLPPGPGAPADFIIPPTGSPPSASLWEALFQPFFRGTPPPHLSSLPYIKAVLFFRDQ